MKDTYIKNWFSKKFIPIFLGAWILCSATFFFVFNYIGGELNEHITIKALAIYFTVAFFLATVFSLNEIKGIFKNEKVKRK